jgi:HlyD family secretion protein
VQPALEVEEGQLLAELDIGNLEEQLRQAQVTYEQDQLSLQRSIQTAQLAVQRAQIDLDTAQARLNQLREPVSRDVVELARSEVRQAQANLELIRNNASAEKNQAKKSLDAAVSALIYAQQKFGEAKLELDQAMGGLNEDAAYAKFEGTAVDLRTAEENVAKAQIVYDTAVGNEIAVIKNAEALVDLAQARLDKVLLGPDKYELDAAQREVARARVAVQEAQQRAQPDTEMTKRVADSEFQVKQLQDQITARRLYAPFSGVIGSINVSTGFPVRAGSVVLTIVDPSQTEILTDNITGRDVTRVNAAKLSVGQEVEVSFSRYPDRTFAGTITEVPNRLADGSASGEATYHISYPSRGAVLDIGDLAALKITLGRKYNTLWLPPAAVRLTETPFVFVKDGDGERRVNIQVGIVSPDRVEILSGLNENDVVLGQ